MARRRIIIGVVAGVLVLGALYFLFGRGGESPLQAINPFNNEPPVPTFEFTSVTPKYEATQAHIQKKKLAQAAKQTAPSIQDVITELLQAGYVDPDGWGDAGAIDDLFNEDAAQQIDPNVDVLTLGAHADATVTSVNPLPSKLKVTTLLDGNIQAIRALGELQFKAKATNDDGSTTKITLTGTIFLVPDGDHWKIEAFDLDREEQQHAAHTPSASTSTSPTEAG